MQSNYTKGDIIECGWYPYGEDGEKRPLEWVVIEHTDNAALLITKNAIDTQPYKKKASSMEDERFCNCAWKTSDARKWLNKKFLTTAFSDEERIMIIPTKTEEGCFDKVFYLSNAEFQRYMPEKHIYPQVTPYAAKQGYAAVRFGNSVFHASGGFHGEDYDPSKVETGICRDWWLRTLGEDDASVQTVFAEGAFFDKWAEKYGFEHLKSSLVYLGNSSPIYVRGQYGALCSYIASRPAMWICTSLSDEEKQKRLADEERKKREQKERLEEKRRLREEQKRRLREEQERRLREEQERRLREEEKRRLREEEKRRLREEEKRRLRELQQSRRNMRVCQHCGGEFKGLFRKKCSSCGKLKDY